MEDLRALEDRAADLAARGKLVGAIALAKRIVVLDPAHVATQATLAALYARRTAPAPARAATAEERAAAIPLGPGPAEAPRTPLERVAEAARDAVRGGVEDEVEIQVEPQEDAPGSLPRIPLFSDLSREAFLALAEGTVLRTLASGEAVLRERETGASFFAVASGRLCVSRRDDRGEDVVLAHLAEGDFFGEMALLSGAPRSATVRAEGPAGVLEIRPDLLLDLAGRHPHVLGSLHLFYRRRLLANAMALSPVFRPFPVAERKRVMSRFRSREVARGEVVVREGEPSDGLYVVLAGEAAVVKRRGPAELEVARLREGDLFGEGSCLRKAPATATVRALRHGTLLRLPRPAFDELVMTHPPVLELVADLSEERAETLDAILSGHARWTEDGLVLV